MSQKPKIKKRYYRRVKVFFRFLIGKEKMPSKVSYFPDEPHKSAVRIFFEQCVHIFRFGEINRYYYLYGLDVEGTSFKKKGLLAFKEHLDVLYYYNRPRNPFNYVCILSDKKLFAIVCEYFGISCAKDLGFIDPGQLVVRLNDDVLEDLFHLLERENNIFCKPLDSECGRGVFSIGRVGEGEYLLNDCPTTREEIERLIGEFNVQLLVQRRLLQHPEMNRMYPKSINTIRLVTIRNRHTGEIEYFHSLLRIGAGGNVVDNWSQGGVCVGVGEDGVLLAEGYFKPQYGLRTLSHPDTGVVFEGFEIPYYHEAVEMCKRFHKKIDFIPAIGWDVAITPDGPCLIEANDNWAISLHQVYGGLRERFDSLLR